MAVLITGGAGFIGRHTAKLLTSAGFKVAVLDDLSTGVREGAPFGDFIQGDVADTALVRKILREFEVTAVLHLAASANVSDSLRNPGLYFANNTCATAALLDAMIAENVGQIVFSSSCSVYGNCDTAGASEFDSVFPVSPYGASKLATEQMLPWYEKAFGLRWIALRYFNVAGASEGLGEDIRKSRRIIPRAVSAALGQGPPLDIFGTDFSTADGTAIRDFVHVMDVAAANLSALQYLEEDRPGEAINIGCGVGTSVYQIVSAVSEQAECEVPCNLKSSRPGDPSRAISDVSKAELLLNWSPRHSTLEKIVADVLCSHRTSAAFAARKPQCGSAADQLIHGKAEHDSTRSGQTLSSTL